MNKLLDWLRQWWPRIPADIRHTIMLAAVSVITVFAVLAWRDGYRPVGMEKVLTRETSQSQLDELRRQLEENRAQAISDAIQQYDTNIRQYLLQERSLGMDTLVKPAVEMLFAVDNRVKRIERSLKVTNEKVDLMPQAYEEKLRKIIDDQARADNTAALLQQVLKRLDDQDADRGQMQQAIEELRLGRRVSKQKF